MSDELRIRPDLDEERPEDEELRHHEETVAAPGSSTTAAAETGGGSTIRQASLWGDAWIELRHNPLFVIASLLIATYALMTVAPQLFTNADPRACNLSNSLDRPSAAHWFGFDVQGCDYYAQVIYGARSSISVGLLTVGTAAVIGVVFGSLAGYFGGWFDAIVARMSDIVFAIPTTLGGIVFLSAVEEQGIREVSAILVLLGWPTMLRLMRSAVLSTKESDYVDAARALGASDARIIRRHIIPNAIAPVVVYATIYVGIIVAAEAALTFIGVGLQLPAISWGLMLGEAQRYLLTAPHLLLFPGVALSLAILSFILMGDALRDALDPKLR